MARRNLWDILASWWGRRVPELEREAASTWTVKALLLDTQTSADCVTFTSWNSNPTATYQWTWTVNGGGEAEGGALVPR